VLLAYALDMVEVSAFAQMAQRLNPLYKEVCMYGYLGANVVLRDRCMAVKIPRRLERVPEPPLLEKGDLSYSLRDFPVPEEPESMLSAVALIDVMNRDSVVNICAMMRMAAIQHSVPINCVTTDMVAIPVSPALFSDTEPVKVTKNSGTIVRDVTRKFIKLIPPGDPLFVLWGDGGNMLPLVTKLKPQGDIFWVITSDCPDPYYASKVEILKGERAWHDHVTRIEYDGTMDHFVKNTDFSKGWILANYVPASLVVKNAKGVHCVYQTLTNCTAVVGLPDDKHLVKDYATMRFAKDIVAGKKVSLLDGRSDRKAVFDHHAVWVDEVVTRVSGSVPLRDIATCIYDKAYKGGLMVYQYAYLQGADELVGDGFVEYDPYKIHSNMLDDTRLCRFDFERVVVHPMTGNLTFNGKVYPFFLKQDDFVVYACVKGVWYVLDVAWRNKSFLYRRDKLMSMGVPVAPYGVGAWAVCFDAAPLSYMQIIDSYREDCDFDEDFFGIAMREPEMVSRSIMSGIVCMGGEYVLAPGVEFFRYEEFESRRALTNKDRWENYRIKYGSTHYVQRGKFVFQDYAVGVLGVPPERELLGVEVPLRYRGELIEVVFRYAP